MKPIIEYLERRKESENNYDDALGFIIENTNDFISTILPFLIIHTKE